MGGAAGSYRSPVTFSAGAWSPRRQEESPRRQEGFPLALVALWAFRALEAGGGLDGPGLLGLFVAATLLPRSTLRG